MAGTVEAIWVSPCSSPRNEAAGCGDVGFALAALELAELEAEVDEQAVAARPRPIMAVRILARLCGFTVLPSRKATAFHVQPETTRPAVLRCGQAASPARGPALLNERASGPVKTFMLRQTREVDLELFYEISGRARPSRGDDIPMSVAMPAFMVSELTTAFRMGLFLYVPLLLVDLLVASILMSMGMMMVPPTLISLPLKIAIFVMADGWRLVVASLVRSFA